MSCLYFCTFTCFFIQFISTTPLEEQVSLDVIPTEWLRFNDLEYDQVPNLISAMSGYDVSKSTPYSEAGDKGSLSPIFNPIYEEDGKVKLQDFISKAGEEVLCRKVFSTKSITSYDEYRKEKGSSMEFSAGGSVSASGWGVEAKVGYDFGETSEDREVLDSFKTNQGEIVMTTLSCSVYIVEIAEFIKPVFMENFIEGMRMLANGAVLKKKEYFERFLANFGTHYQKQTRLGAKMIYEKRFKSRSQSTSESETRKACTNHAASASIGGSYAGFGGSVEAHTSSKKCKDGSNASNNTELSSETESSLITIGILPSNLEDWETAIKENTQKPLPLQRKLDIITRLFSTRNLEGLKFKNEKTGKEEFLNGTQMTEFFEEQYEAEFLAKYPTGEKGCSISGSCSPGEKCTNKKSSKLGFTCAVRPDLHSIKDRKCKTNDWDKNQSCKCKKGSKLSQIKSTHANRQEDRRWSLACEYFPDLHTTVSEHVEYNAWTSYRATFAMSCGENGYLTGMESHHWNKKEDRQFKFFCGRSSSIKVYNCKGWRSLNDPDRPMDLVLASDEIITELWSEYQKRQKDRKWKVKTCQVKWA